MGTEENDRKKPTMGNYLGLYTLNLLNINNLFYLTIYLSICLSIYLSIYLTTYLPTYLPTYRPTYLPNYSPTYIYLPTVILDPIFRLAKRGFESFEMITTIFCHDRVRVRSATSHCNREYFRDPFLTNKFSLMIILLSSFSYIFFFSILDFIHVENKS
jgi:hypothetical protein